MIRIIQLPNDPSHLDVMDSERADKAMAASSDDKSSTRGRPYRRAVLWLTIASGSGVALVYWLWLL